MGLLGMLAAGAAGGMRDTHNLNVRTQNVLEVEQAKHGMEMDREILREKYLNRRNEIERGQKLEDFKLTNERADKVYDIKRAHELEDLQSGRAHELERDRLRDSSDTARTRLTIAAEDLRHRERMDRGVSKSGSGTKSSTSKPSKFMEQVEADVRSGLAPDEPSAIKSLRLKEILEEISKTDKMSSEEEKFELAKKRYANLYPAASTGPVVAAQAPEVERLIEKDPKTGKLIIK